MQGGGANCAIDVVVHVSSAAGRALCIILGVREALDAPAQQLVQAGGHGGRWLLDWRWGHALIPYASLLSGAEKNVGLVAGGPDAHAAQPDCEQVGHAAALASCSLCR